MEKLKKTWKEKLELIFGSVILILFVAGFSVLMWGMYLTLDPDNYRAEKSFVLPLEKFEAIYDEEKGKAIYRYTTVIGPHRMQNEVLVFKHKKTDERVLLIDAATDEEEKIKITNYVLKNKFYEKLLKQRDRFVSYEFFVNSK